ncbi:MAG: hypothetical protein LH478_02700 [Chitinophagaceae bacterium]|nr:hypothetical protein [Chitinophagaceae bacterium]
MDSTSSSLDFAIIGHQDSWQTITSFINTLRKPDLPELSIEQTKKVFPFIPPREIYKIDVTSATGRKVKGAYIETFIEPDKLTAEYARKNVCKVMKAIALATKIGAKIVTLGGFTSIVLEGKVAALNEGRTHFTTGNTLTAAFIVKAVEKAACQKGFQLGKSNVLIIGATGDIGIACMDYFKNKVGQLLLCARNKSRLQQVSNSVMGEQIQYKSSVFLDELIAEADVIIGVASSSNINLAGCKPGVLICDAGYPKNMDAAFENNALNDLFHGGMGQVKGGYSFMPDYSKEVYSFPVPHVAYGCTLEAVVLALESKYEAYSFGKGNITVDNMEKMYSLCQKHGITLSPFYNSSGLCKMKGEEAINF